MRTYEVIARTNGHEWINWGGMVCCKTCGIVRRSDDSNSTCKGPVKIAPREALTPQEGERDG
jgi:hypothetical protein